MTIERKIADIITPVIHDMGYELVQVRIMGQGGSVVQIMAEPIEDRDTTVEDCETISHAVSAVLDVEDPISGNYTLEVSSPGIDRPLTRPKDFDNWADNEAKIELHTPIDGRRRYRGQLLGINDDQIVQIRVDGQVYDVPFDNIYLAKLVLTDELIKKVTQG